MRNYKSKKKLEIETPLASTMLYYNLEEFTSFILLWTEIENDPDFEASGLFIEFVSSMKKIMKKENEEKINKEFILERLRKYNKSQVNSEKQKAYDMWLTEIALEDDPEIFKLGQELFYSYAWEVFKESIKKIDKSDIPFKEKLLVEPVRVDYTEIEDIFKRVGDYEVKREEERDNISTGFSALDRDVNPKYSNLMIIAARPSVGKSTLLLKQAQINAAQGRKGLFISLEMTEEQLYKKLYSSYKGRDVQPEEYNEIKKEPGFRKIHENLIFVVNHSNNGDTILDLASKSIRDHGTRIIYLDYLQLVRYHGMDEWASFRKATHSFKNFATTNKVLFSTCSQVSRESENYGIELSSMYGSSSIEADADIVIAMERNDRDMIESSVKRGDIKVLKNRDGKANFSIGTLIDYVTSEFTEVKSGGV